MAAPFPGDIYPRPSSSGELMKEWRDQAARAARELQELDGPLHRAHAGGNEVGSQSRNIEAAVNRLAPELVAADPRDANAAIGGALSNSAGADQSIRQAEQQAGDPRAPLVSGSTTGAEAAVEAEAARITAGGREIERSAGAADEFERRAGGGGGGGPEGPRGPVEPREPPPRPGPGPGPGPAPAPAPGSPPPPPLTPPPAPKPPPAQPPPPPPKEREEPPRGREGS